MMSNRPLPPYGRIIVSRSTIGKDRFAGRRAGPFASLLGLPIALVGLSGVCLAESRDQGLARCARIGAAEERLACYDALAATPAPAVSTQSAPEKPVARSPAPEPKREVTAAERAENFGFENRPDEDALVEVQSRYDGEFTGWSGSTLFRLENGQVWKQTEWDRVGYRAMRPMITIRRGSLGTYRLRVEGLKTSIRVERVK
jgi:hypothetical protein